MVGERTMWLVWHPISGISYVDDDERDAIALACDENEAMWGSLQLCGWRCSQITVKEADEQVIALGNHVESMRLYYERARENVYAEGRRQALEEAANSLDIPDQTIRLHAGELSASEMRAVKAVLVWKAAAIRALKEPKA